VHKSKYLSNSQKFSLKKHFVTELVNFQEQFVFG
jgi:hypothetical protein